MNDPKDKDRLIALAKNNKISFLRPCQKTAPKISVFILLLNYFKVLLFLYI